MSTITVEKYLLIEDEQERKDKWEELALLYCDGVGTAVSGPVYKLVGEGIFFAISYYIGALVTKWLWSGWSYAKMQAAAAEQNYEKLCKTTSETAWWSFQRQARYVNEACKDAGIRKEKWIYKVNEASRDVIDTIWNGIWSVLGGTGGATTVAAGVDVANKDSNFTRARLVLHSIFTLQDKIVCMLAALIESLVTVCSMGVGAITGTSYQDKLKF
tara:strand:+ start:5939 stop:6583 length:645 start_codon:yes stop_codon:yes gene_type:complete